MPSRHVDGSRLRTYRGAAQKSQQQLADSIGVTGAVVGNWEAGRTSPPQEKLPGLAAALQQDLDILFPRTGLPDLADLRCDAGRSLSEVRSVLNARSDSTLRKAEGGRQRLAVRHHEPLAQAYGVSVEEILAAQDRSFGHDVPAVVKEEPFEVPRTIAEKISFMVEQTYHVLERPTDAQLADHGNSKIGSKILTEELVYQLRTGERRTASSDELHALTAALDAPASLFGDDDAEVRRIVSTIRMMKSVSGLAKRGGGEALSPELMDFISNVINEHAGGGHQSS